MSGIKICKLFGSDDYQLIFELDIQLAIDALNFQTCSIDEDPSVIITNKEDFIENIEKFKSPQILERTIVLSQEKDLDNINDLIYAHKVRHVIPSSLAKPNTEKIISLILKLVSSPNIRLQFDVGKEVKVSSEKISNVADVNPQTERLIKNIDISRNYMGTEETLRTIANELAMNGIFNAPVDEEGKYKYRNVDRFSLIELSDREKVGYCFFEDKKIFGIYARDNFGTLDYETVIEYLYQRANKIPNKNSDSTGFGAGLYMAFRNSNRFIVNSMPGEFTEMIMIHDRTQRFKDFKEKQTLFSFYNVYDPRKHKPKSSN